MAHLASAPVPLLPELLWLPDRSRNMGIHLMAGKGSGKSRLMGRVIAWLDFLRGVPVAILDPMGGTIDNFLDKLVGLPPPLQERLWKRVWYVDASGQNGYVIPMPLYYRLGNESLFAISQRYLDVVRKLDPHLQTASVEGWNPLWKLGSHVGMILSVLNYQITEAEDVVLRPQAWLDRLHQAHTATITPEMASAIHAFEAFAHLKEDIRARGSAAFLNKIAMFTLDPTMRAMFGATQPLINWQQVVDQRQIVLFDFRGETDVERRRFRMVWAFQTLLAYIKHRGMGRHRPISLIVDELTSLFSPSVLATDLFAADLDELINVVARNCMVWLTIAHQELFQLSSAAQKTLMAMGTQILGVTSDREAAVTLARQFFPYDPSWVKKITDYGTVEFTLDEQAYLRSNAFTDQGRFHFLARVASGEGDTQGELRPITLARFDPNSYPNEELVAQARESLMRKRGRRVSEVLSEIESRRTAHPKKAQGLQASATLEEDGAPNDDRAFNDSIFREKKAATGAQARRAR